MDQYHRNGYIKKQGNIYLFHPIEMNRLMQKQTIDSHESIG